MPSCSARTARSSQAGGWPTSKPCRTTCSRWTAAACLRSRGSWTATRTPASRATASRSSRCARPARATRSSTRPAAGSSRRYRRHAPRAPTGFAERWTATASGCSAPGRPRSKGSPATGSIARRSSILCGRSRTAGGIPTWLGAHAVPPEFDDADAYLDFALTEVLPDAAGLAEAADVFLERGAFDVDQARRYLEACRAAGLELRIHGDQFTELGAVPLAIELGARSVDHLEATGDDGVRALAASEVVGVLLPASALVLGRPMPSARKLVDAGAASRARHRLQPRQRVLREPSARLLPRLHATRPVACGGPSRVHGQRRTRARASRDAGTARARLQGRRRASRRP